MSQACWDASCYEQGGRDIVARVFGTNERLGAELGNDEGFVVPELVWWGEVDHRLMLFFVLFTTPSSHQYRKVRSSYYYETIV